MNKKIYNEESKTKIGDYTNPILDPEGTLILANMAKKKTDKKIKS